MIEEEEAKKFFMFFLWFFIFMFLMAIKKGKNYVGGWMLCIFLLAIISLLHTHENVIRKEIGGFVVRVVCWGGIGYLELKMQFKRTDGRKEGFFI